MVQIGDHVMFRDENKKDRHALVQCIHNQELINVAVLCDDASREDSYGRQIEHKTSLPRRNEHNADFGFYFYEV